MACGVCGNLSDEDPCPICRDPWRDAALLCVVEESGDVNAIERAGRYRGRYHVLGGRISPLDGVGPDELHLDRLLARLTTGSEVREVIVATNPSMEGEATATYLQQILKPSGVRVTRIARGQLVATVGETPQFDPTAFASLTAADFSANDQLAKMIGEAEFASLVHQGERESMYLADFAKRVILVVLFDQRATLGLVKLKAKSVVGALNKVFEEMFNRVGTGQAQQKGLLEGAEDEIDKLFG